MALFFIEYLSSRLCLSSTVVVKCDTQRLDTIESESSCAVTIARLLEFVSKRIFLLFDFSKPFSDSKDPRLEVALLDKLEMESLISRRSQGKLRIRSFIVGSVSEEVSVPAVQLEGSSVFGMRVIS